LVTYNIKAIIEEMGFTADDDLISFETIQQKIADALSNGDFMDNLLEQASRLNMNLFNGSFVDIPSLHFGDYKKTELVTASPTMSPTDLEISGSVNQDSTNSGLHRGAIAGIVIGAVVCCGLVILLGFFIHAMKYQQQQKSATATVANSNYDVRRAEMIVGEPVPGQTRSTSSAVV